MNAPRAGPVAAPGGRPAAPEGFTLLELLVVLALLGIVTAIAVPNLERLYAGVTRQAARDTILDQFVGIGQRAMRRGRNYVVFGTGDAAVGDASRYTAYEPYPIELPAGWEIRLDPPLRIRANGVCEGAGLILHHQGIAEPRIELRPPYCRVDPQA